MVRDHGAAGEREERLGQVERERPEARPLLRARDQDHRLHRRHLHLDTHLIGSNFAICSFTLALLHCYIF